MKLIKVWELVMDREPLLPQPMGSLRVGHLWMTELKRVELTCVLLKKPQINVCAAANAAAAPCRFSRVWLCATPYSAAHQVPHPWDSPGKNTGVGCLFLLQCIKVKVKSLSSVLLLATPWTAAHQAPPSLGFSRQEYWTGVPLPSPT